MNILSFVGASSALLLAWLGVTFFHEIQPDRYQQGRKSAAAQKSPADETIADTRIDER